MVKGKVPYGQTKFLKLISMNCFLFRLRWRIPEDSDHSGSSEPFTNQNHRRSSGKLYNALRGLGLTPWTVAVLDLPIGGGWKLEWPIRRIFDQYVICEIEGDFEYVVMSGANTFTNFGRKL